MDGRVSQEWVSVTCTGRSIGDVEADVDDERAASDNLPVLVVVVW